MEELPISFRLEVLDDLFNFVVQVGAERIGTYGLSILEEKSQFFPARYLACRIRITLMLFNQGFGAGVFSWSRSRHIGPAPASASIFA